MDLENVSVNKDISIIFMGTPEFAVPILEGLIEKYHVRAIVTQPDKKSGRDGDIIYSPIKQVALNTSTRPYSRSLPRNIRFTC